MLANSTALFLTILIILSTAAFAAANAQLQQVESNGGLTATLNGDSFTTGDTITVSGSVQEQEPNSYISIEVIDPQSRTVESEVVDVTSDNRFTHSFVAGEQEEEFDFEPMETSGNYRMIVSYFTPDFDREVVEFVFEYASGSSETTIGEMITDGVTMADSDISTSSDTINVTAINQSIAHVIRYTELAYLAMQNNESRDALTNLESALDELDSIQGNLTLTAPGGNSTNNNIDNTTTAETRGAIASSDSGDNGGGVNITDTSTTTGTSIIPGSASLTTAAYLPNPVQVSIGDKVTWRVNNDGV
ncbi:MAG: hypothetical protein M3299_01100 [Thermoproteota archaeon]|nr:hypothetical protein [Thermoproteota archaeon]